MRGLWGGFPKIFAKQSTIAEKCGLKEDTVRKCLAQLKKTGWILSERQHISHGNNRYWICDEPFKKRSGE
jgi:DNA-binding transcriptional regulator PaaX